MEGKIHRDMFSLFYSVWKNSDPKIFQVIKHLLETAPKNSSTWAINLRHICKMYQLTDPLTWLQTDPLPKSEFKELVSTKITTFHESELRLSASRNTKMKYFNVSCQGLRGKHHPCLGNVVTANEVKKLRIHLKFMTGDYLTCQTKYEHTNKGSPQCKICDKEYETVCHIIATCEAYAMFREHFKEQSFEICQAVPGFRTLKTQLNQPEVFTQFVLDPSSLNLPMRVNNNDPILTTLFSLIRDYCSAIHNERMHILNQL